MKKSDLILILVLTIVSAAAYFGLNFFGNDVPVEDLVAEVTFRDKEILLIYLEDGSYEVLDASMGIIIDEENNQFTIPDTNGTHDLIIGYDNHKVKVLEEVSPLNICSNRDWSNSQVFPITCLPNNLVIVVREIGKLPPIDDVT